MKINCTECNNALGELKESKLTLESKRVSRRIVVDHDNKTTKTMCRKCMTYLDIDSQGNINLDYKTTSLVILSK